MARSEGQLNEQVLRRFDQLARLGQDQLAALASRVQVLEAGTGTALVELGSRDPHTVFLLDGQVRLEAPDGYIRFITHRDDAARSPLCRLRPSRWRALAATPVRYLLIADDLLEKFAEERSGQVPASGGYAVAEIAETDEDQLDGPEDALLCELFHDLRHRRVVVPSLPRVARQVAAEIAGADATQAALALMQDPALALKVLHRANGRRRTGAQARSLRVAVGWLGIEEIRDLVTQCALLETFRSPNVELEQRAEQWWQQSLLTAQASRALAHRLEGFDPDYAALIGLALNIGEAFILSYAQREPTAWISDSRLERCIHRRSPEIGRFVLSRWQLPPDLARTAAQAGNWWRDTEQAPDYTDLALVAQLIVLRDRAPSAFLPEVDELPSAHRLSGGQSFIGDCTDELLSAARGSLARSVADCAA